jgi:hypothetical protein
VGPFLIVLSYFFKQLEMRLFCHFIMLKTLLSEKLKLEVGPFLIILSYLFKQLEMGLVSHFKILKRMLSEKIEVRGGTPFDYSFLFVQTA